MIISSAQLIPSAAAKGQAPENKPASKLLAKAVSQITEPARAPAASTPVEVFGPKLSTNLRIDGQHRIYYQVINDHSGEVICEIPSEEIRNLEARSSLPPGSEGPGLRIDVKS